MTDLLTSIGRGQALFRVVWVSVFGLLGLYITVRMIAQGADAFGVILIAGLTALVWWRAWSLFQNFRHLSAPPRE
jgi:hypothetical protein